MAFSKFQLTTAGTELLNRVLAENKTLVFTKFEIGDGNFTGEVKQLTSLVSKVKEFDVLDTNIVNDQVNLRAFFDNSDLEEEKYLKEIGVFARIGEEFLSEVLFSYSNSADTAELIPDKTEYFSRTLSIYSYVGDVQSVTFSVDLKIEKNDFNTREELRISNLEVGSKINLWGSNELGDTYKTSYIITDEVTNFQLANGLYAKLYSQPLEMGRLPKDLLSAEDIFKMQVSNAGAEYDEDNLYINNNLLKKKDYYYIDTEQIGLWRCKADTNINYNSTEFFENESNREHARKLENLGKSVVLWEGEAQMSEILINLSDSFLSFRVIEIIATNAPVTTGYGLGSKVFTSEFLDTVRKREFPKNQIGYVNDSITNSAGSFEHMGFTVESDRQFKTLSLGGTERDNTIVKIIGIS